MDGNHSTLKKHLSSYPELSLSWPLCASLVIPLVLTLFMQPHLGTLRKKFLYRKLNGLRVLPSCWMVLVFLFCKICPRMPNCEVSCPFFGTPNLDLVSPTSLRSSSPKGGTVDKLALSLRGNEATATWGTGAAVSDLAPVQGQNTSGLISSAILEG